MKHLIILGLSLTFILSCAEESITPFALPECKIIRSEDDSFIRTMAYSNDRINNINWFNKSTNETYLNLEIINDQNGFPDKYIYSDNNQEGLVFFDLNYSGGKISEIITFAPPIENKQYPVERYTYEYDEIERLDTYTYGQYAKIPESASYKYLLLNTFKLIYDSEGNAKKVVNYSGSSSNVLDSLIIHYNTYANIYKSMVYLVPGHISYNIYSASTNNPTSIENYQNNDLVSTTSFKYEYNTNDLPIMVNQTYVNTSSQEDSSYTFIELEYDCDQ